MKILIQDIIYKRNLTLRQAALLTGIPKSTLEDTAATEECHERHDGTVAKGLKVRITDLFDSPYQISVRESGQMSKNTNFRPKISYY